MREICIHGHFYQPTRVNPWTNRIEPQPSAAPFLDWNERITAECYAPNAAARLLDEQGRTRGTRNTYGYINFDFGPTLLNWLDRNHPVVLEQLRKADRDSIARFGKGSAIAQPYHHPILPLCDDQDRKTEIRWGLAVFERCFGRKSEGIWLAETAVDTPTLECLVDEGIEFVLLAPTQIDAIQDDNGQWYDASETAAANRAFKIELPSGRSISAVVYDAAVSRGVAFEGLLHSGERFANRLADASHGTGFVLIATDGESYGHHHTHGEMALAYAQEQLDARSDCTLTNVASWLSRNPAKQVARIVERSSWSCAHGIGRWADDCGCKIDPGRDWHQAWRPALRAALEELRDRARIALEPLGKKLFADSTTARNEFIDVLDAPSKFSRWYADFAGPEADEAAAYQWLSTQQKLLAMFTSCAWFFDDVTGLEPIQNIRLAAAAAAQLRDLSGVDLIADFRAAVDAIPANLDTKVLVDAIDANITSPDRLPADFTGISVDDRRAGVLQPISALGNQGPIGDLDGAVSFIDWLVEAGAGLWQFLPLVPTDDAGSPYSSWSTLSGNPDLVGLAWCVRNGLLPQEARLERQAQVDYEKVRNQKRPLILQAAKNLVNQPSHLWFDEYTRFVEQSAWARDAALFYAIKKANADQPWWQWPDALRKADPAALAQAKADYQEDYQTWTAALFLFEQQWSEIRGYAASRGVKMMGDMPIYVGQDSVDVWSNQPFFMLDDRGLPTRVAGVPPDAYSDTGQRWGNPLFDWSAMAADGYQWWIERIRRSLDHCDALRVDHFIAFARYWSVDAEAETALGGHWVPGPGRAVFDAIRAELGRLPLVAEDLGSVDQTTIDLRDSLELPGMKVLQFSFDADDSNPHKVQNHPELSVAYTSTHDSPTARGWWDDQGDDTKRWLNIGSDGETACRTQVDETLGSPSCWAIIPLQDLLCLPNSARMNTPGTCEGNWLWRQAERDLPQAVATDVRKRIRAAGRLIPQAARPDSAPTIAAGSRSNYNGDRIAYFCMEYGISAELPIYSGGLGVLAGDIVKAASDQNRDFIAIGMLWGEGYFVQDIDSEGRQLPRYIPTPRTRLRPTGVTVNVKIGSANVAVTAWRVLHLGSVELLLLEPIDEEHRWITQRLYGGSSYDRVAQEVLLGVGGVRVLRALGIPIDVYHFNEGHALFAGFELVREFMEKGQSFEEAIASSRKQTIFTTHTPVPAGNEVHPLQLLFDVGAHVDAFSWEQLKEIGGDPFQMTPAALRLCRQANAVAELHGETAREMWKDIEGAAPIVAITNGVHMGTWQDPVLAGHSRRGHGEALWERHQLLKQQLIDEIKTRLGVTMDVDVPLIGFARRAATYKRATLLLRDRQWLHSMLAEKKVQFVFAGKAHPHDVFGQALIQELVKTGQEYPGQVVFIPNYDMNLGALLTRGCDVWLNNPIRPKEASGTSGMKAAANGVLNLSILDGWWAEGCQHGLNGWGVGAPPEGVDADQHDYDALRTLIEQDVLPAYSNTASWVEMMQTSISSSQVQFSSNRCVQRYFDELYHVVQS
ncbi:MAG: 4-alpha-glucanotransferase [Myxococcota bacterium]|nr:4-alpha-glucanotransferase [Myxococcota bacterium]